MKHPRLPRTTLLVSAFLIFASPLSACAPASRSPNPPATESHPAAVNPPSPSAESALRAYYEALIADLNQALLAAKQDDYITKTEYENRIAELESRLDALTNPHEPPDEVTDLPVSTTPTPPADTTQTPATSDFAYTAEKGEITIRAYRGAALRVTIPPAINGLPVTRIADDAFRAAPVTRITLPDTVTEIGWFSFADCPSLTAVTLPSSVKTIGYGAFENTPNVTVLCPKGSYAEAYAQSFGIDVMESKP